MTDISHFVVLVLYAFVMYNGQWIEWMGEFLFKQLTRPFHSLFAQPQGQADCLPWGLCEGLSVAFDKL